jgi:hypothetical protein
MARKSTENIKINLNRINLKLAELNIHVAVEGRYGYKAVKLYTGSFGERGSNLATFRTGLSAKEVAYFLDGMDSMIQIIEEYC